MAISQEGAPFLVLWPQVVEAVEARASSAELWQSLRDAGAEAGLIDPEARRAWGSAGWQAVNEMRSVAAAQRNGWERFSRDALGRDWATARADPARWANLHPDAQSTTFIADHAAPEINVRPAELRAILPEYLVRFEAHFIDPEGAYQTHWLTMRDEWRPGITVQDVVDQVHVAAEDALESHDTLQGELVGVARLRPVTI